jgi:hypothetical protein
MGPLKRSFEQSRGRFLEVSQEITGLMRVEGNNADTDSDDGIHLRLVKPRGGYSVQLHGNRGFRNGNLAPFKVVEIQYRESKGELAYSEGSKEGVEHSVVDYG